MQRNIVTVKETSCYFIIHVEISIAINLPNGFGSFPAETIRQNKENAKVNIVKILPFYSF